MRSVRREMQQRPPVRTSRRLAGVAATAVALSLAAACVGTGSDQDDTDDDPAAIEMPPEDISTELSIWSYQDANAIPAWWTDAIDRFNETYPNVTVNTTNIPYANMPERLLGSGLSDSIPDGVLFNPADAAKLFEADIVMDLASFWEEFDDADQFPDSAVWRHGDAVISVQGHLNTTALWYNEDILAEAGIEVPETIEEFGAALAAVDAAGYGGFLTGAQPNGSGEFDFFPWLMAYGQNYGDWDRDTLITVFELFGEWIDAGYIPQDITGNNEGDNHNVFASGQWAFVQNGNWNLTAAESDFDFEWGVAELPAGPEGSHSVGGGEGFSIGADTEHPYLVWALFEEMVLTSEAELAALEEDGRLPVRADASQDPRMAEDPNLAVYADVVANLGSRPSTPLVGDYLIAMGTVWNSFVGGAIDAETAADQVIEQMSEL